MTTSVSNLVIELEDPPTSISGTVSYAGRQSGVIKVVASYTSDWSDVSDATTVDSTGFYHLTDLGQTSYRVKAWIDADTDEAFDSTDSLDAMDDADIDGYPNVYECVHETDPRNASSAPDEGGLDPGPTPTITVTTNGAQTIHQALGAATNDYDIVAVADGVYTGAGNRDIEFPERPVLLLGPGGYASVVLDCQEAGRGLVFTSRDRRTPALGLCTVQRERRRKSCCGPTMGRNVPRPLSLPTDCR